MRRGKAGPNSTPSLLDQGETAYSSQNPDVHRREKGVTFTPQWVVDLMFDLLETGPDTDFHIVDAGAGLGRFSLTAAQRFPKVQVTAIENDRVLARGLRESVRGLGFEKRVDVLESDFLDVSFRAAKHRLFLGNPPYIRHHVLTPRRKAWLRSAGDRLGRKFSGLSGLHVYFLARVLSEASRNDRLMMILPSEWMETGYGTAIKAAILERATTIRLYMFAAEQQVFEGTMTTSVILDLQFGGPTREFLAVLVTPSPNLSLSRPTEIRLPARSPESENWLRLAKDALCGEIRPTESHEESIELGDLFDVHRGQVTGMNSIWIASDATASLIPERFLYPCVTDAREILGPADAVLRSTEGLRRVIDLPESFDPLDSNDTDMIRHFLDLAERAGADKTYIGRHRRPWWRVGLHDPPAIIMSYMARRPPRFVLNHCGARLLNIAHGLYPKENLSSDELAGVVRWLNERPQLGIGRTYAGGLIKVEPGDARRIRIPDPRLLKLQLAA